MPIYVKKRNEWIGTIAAEETIESELEKKRIIMS